MMGDFCSLYLLAFSRHAPGAAVCSAVGTCDLISAKVPADASSPTQNLRVKGATCQPGEVGPGGREGLGGGAEAAADERLDGRVEQRHGPCQGGIGRPPAVRCTPGQSNWLLTDRCSLCICHPGWRGGTGRWSPLPSQQSCPCPAAQHMRVMLSEKKQSRPDWRRGQLKAATSVTSDGQRWEEGGGGGETACATLPAALPVSCSTANKLLTNAFVHATLGST